MWPFPEARDGARRLLSRPWVVGVAAFGMTVGGYAAARSPAGPVTVRVQRADLPLTIDVDGELTATASTDLGAPVVRDVWEFKITFLAPEGALVRRGQPVVAFDPSAVQRQLEEKSAEFEEARKKIERKEVELVAQRQDLALQLAEAEGRVRKARLKSEVPEEMRTRNEVRATALDLRNATEAVENLRARIAAVGASEEAALRALVTQRDRARGRVSELQAAMEAMTVRAPQDGIVIYKTGWSDQKKKVGDSTWFGEKLVALPDLAVMRADGDIDEADGGSVAVGQPATLRLEALPDRDFRAKVGKIGRAVRRKSWRVPSKVFRVQIDLERGDAALRPAMRFRGEIETGVVKAALVVPRDCVFARPAGPVVWVRHWNGFREVPVTIGARNRRSFEIKAGVGEGDEIAAADIVAERRP